MVETLLKLYNQYFPISDPVNVFSVVMLIIFLAPILIKKIRLPEVTGIIFAGIILGPKGLNILKNDDSILLFGTVGILYIMFYSGLEVNIGDFKKKIHKSLIFGLLTFGFPQLLGTVTSFYFMNIGWGPSILLASMYASHTLLSYPVVSKMDAKNDESVLVTIGGTLVTNSISLIILAVMVSMNGGNLDKTFWIKLPISLIIFVGLVMYFVPKIASWYFKNAEVDSSSHFILVMALVFVTAALSKFAGLEPIIGAFLAGFAINRLIPANSLLMNRIDFMGNALFIPFFLIYVGMLVDIRVFFNSFEAIKITIIMTVVATFTKWLAAYVTAKLLNYSKDQRNLIFGLSNAQAANTLAAVLIAYKLEIFDVNILNGTIGMILVTCIISAVYTEKSAKKITIISSGNDSEELAKDYKNEKILVPLSNPKTLPNLVDLAILVKKPENKEPIYPLIVASDTENAEVELKEKQKLLELASKHASGSANFTNLLSRIDINPASGIVRVIRELDITHLIMGWNGKLSATSRLFGSTLDHILEKTNNILIVAKSEIQWGLTKRVVLVLPTNAEFDHGFYELLNTILYLSVNIKSSILLIGTENQLDILNKYTKKLNINIDIMHKKPGNIYETLKKEKKEYDLPVVYATRKGTAIYNYRWSNNLPKYLSEIYKKENFIITYPPNIEIQKNYQTK